MPWRLALVAFITAVEHRFVPANPTTVALSFLLAVLVVSAYWGLRVAAVQAVAATAAFNFYFLPPIGTFTIADPQNWVALFSFLTTALVASNLSDRVRREAAQATRRRTEVERLYAFSQLLLTSESSAALLNAIPSDVVTTFGAEGAALMLNSRETIYRSRPDLKIEAGKLNAVASRGEMTVLGEMEYLPLRVGVRNIGAMAIQGHPLSRESLEAIGSLVGLAIERSHAMEMLTKSQTEQESERLRSALLDSVTHEFRTPLTSIMASVTGLLAESHLDDAQRRELLTVIQEEAERLIALWARPPRWASSMPASLQLELRANDIGTAIEGRCRIHAAP